MSRQTAVPTIPQNQFTTLDQAVQFAVRADMAGVGGGVMPIDDSSGYHNDISGIFLEPWGSSDFAEPSEGERRQFKIRYKATNPDGSHIGSFNIGLYIEMAIGHAGPGALINWDYAIKKAKEEVDAQIVNSGGPQ